MVILLFGPPGSGKGTQSPQITALLKIPAISTGEMLRAECEAGTPLGKIASEVLAKGHLVSDDLVNQMLIGRLAEPDCRGDSCSTAIRAPSHRPSFWPGFWSGTVFLRPW